MSWNGFIDPVAGFLGQDADSQRNNLGTDADGKYKPTGWDSFWGRADEGQEVLDTTKNKGLRDRWQGQLEGRGLQFTDGMTGGDAQRMILDHDKGVREQEDSKRRQAEFNDPGRVEERRLVNEGNQRNESRYIDLQEQNRLDRATSDKRYLADRADSREQRADELMMRREDMERLDRKDERNRRRDSIAALTAGLASLGAAFAL